MEAPAALAPMAMRMAVGRLEGTAQMDPAGVPGAPSLRLMASLEPMVVVAGLDTATPGTTPPATVALVAMEPSGAPQDREEAAARAALPGRARVAG